MTLSEFSEQTTTPTTAADTVLTTPVVASPDSKPAKQPETYGQRIKKMNSRQLTGELKRKAEDKRQPRINEIFGVVLGVVFENHLKGMNPYPR